MTENPATPWPLWTAEAAAAAAGPGTEHAELGLAQPCPECGRPVRPDESYCENCGAALTPAAAAERVVVSCLECGGEVDQDGYCQVCGAKAPSPRDHYEQAPADWVGGVCDRGILHYRNEDAMALWVDPDVRRAVLVVCDGVSSSKDSDVAAQAGADRACQVLSVSQPEGVGVDASHDAAMTAALIEAVQAANESVIASTDPASDNAASCTFTAAVVHGDDIHFANVGDSRIYWLGETRRVQLSTDHSVAEELIRAGASRDEAENSDQAHAITRWLGRDADDTAPSTGVLPVTEGGWLVVCSDGLWNYASEPDALAEQLGEALNAGTDPVGVAGRLVKWANAQGGKDNITVALAYIPANLNDTPSNGTLPDTTGSNAREG